MPIEVHHPIRRINQNEFGEVSYEVMSHVLAIHNEMGRFFNEKVYKRQLANRLSSVRLELPIQITFASFRTQLFVDVLVGDGAIFEFKAVETLNGRHRAQLLNYLMLCDLAHGKLINVRPSKVEHEFVNCNWIRSGRICFEVDSSRWNASLPGVSRLKQIAIDMLKDLGAGLDLSLYEETLCHFFGGIPAVETDCAVIVGGHEVGMQKFRVIERNIAIKITGFTGSLRPFELHARRLLDFVNLRAIAWINISMKNVAFITLER